MRLLGTSILNGIAVAVRVAVAMVLNKVLAVYVGPTGYALIGQFQSALAMVINLAGGIVSTGVTKMTAEHFDDQARQHAVWKTALRFSLITSLLAGICLYFLSDQIGAWLFRGEGMGGAFVLLAATLPALAANNLLLAIVNGKKEVGIYVVANIAGSLISLAVTGLLAKTFGLHGALVALAVNPSLTLLATGFMMTRCTWFRVRNLWGPMERNVVRELSGFGLMALTSSLAAPLTHILIRDHLASHLGLAAAGYWQAVWKISEIYLMLVTTTLSVYYLPRLAEIRTRTDLVAEISKVYRFAIPVVIFGASAIYWLRDFIVLTLFTSDFAPMRDLFAWQLVGDVIKIGSWVLAYVMIGRSMVKVFVVTEIVFSVLFLYLTWLCVGTWGLQGVAIAYAANYAIYWLAAVGVLTRGALRKIAPA